MRNIAYLFSSGELEVKLKGVFNKENFINPINGVYFSVYVTDAPTTNPNNNLFN